MVEEGSSGEETTRRELKEDRPSIAKRPVGGRRRDASSPPSELEELLDQADALEAAFSALSSLSPIWMGLGGTGGGSKDAGERGAAGARPDLCDVFGDVPEPYMPEDEGVERSKATAANMPMVATNIKAIADSIVERCAEMEEPLRSFASSQNRKETSLGDEAQNCAHRHVQARAALENTTRLASDCEAALESASSQMLALFAQHRTRTLNLMRQERDAARDAAHQEAREKALQQDKGADELQRGLLNAQLDVKDLETQIKEMKRAVRDVGKLSPEAALAALKAAAFAHKKDLVAATERQQEEIDDLRARLRKNQQSCNKAREVLRNAIDTALVIGEIEPPTKRLSMYEKTERLADDNSRLQSRLDWLTIRSEANPEVLQSKWAAELTELERIRERTKVQKEVMEETFQMKLEELREPEDSAAMESDEEVGVEEEVEPAAEEHACDDLAPCEELHGAILFYERTCTAIRAAAAEAEFLDILSEDLFADGGRKPLDVREKGEILDDMEILKESIMEEQRRVTDVALQRSTPRGSLCKRDSELEQELRFKAEQEMLSFQETGALLATKALENFMQKAENALGLDDDEGDCGNARKKVIDGLRDVAAAQVQRDVAAQKLVDLIQTPMVQRARAVAIERRLRELVDLYVSLQAAQAERDSKLLAEARKQLGAGTAFTPLSLLSGGDMSLLMAQRDLKLQQLDAIERGVVRERRAMAALSSRPEDIRERRLKKEAAVAKARVEVQRLTELHVQRENDVSPQLRKLIETVRQKTKAQARRAVLMRRRMRRAVAISMARLGKVSSIEMQRWQRDGPPPTRAELELKQMMKRLMGQVRLWRTKEARMEELKLKLEEQRRRTTSSMAADALTAAIGDGAYRPKTTLGDEVQRLMLTEPVPMKTMCIRSLSLVAPRHSRLLVEAPILQPSRPTGPRHFALAGFLQSKRRTNRKKEGHGAPVLLLRGSGKWESTAASGR
jgi:hypothetical protein